MQQSDFHLPKLLQRELQKRRAANARYSQRAFARYLGLTSGFLSKVLSGKQGISRSRAALIISKLNLSRQEAEIILACCDANWSRSPYVRKSAILQVQHLASKIHMHLSVLAHLRDWRCFGILEALRVEASELNTPQALANYFGIDPSDISISLNSSKQLGLVTEKGGLWQRTGEQLVTPNDIPSALLNDCHRATLESARERLQMPPENREFQSLILAFDRKRVLEAKAMIRAFVDSFNQKFESAEGSTDVFCLNVNFFSQRHCRE